MDEPEINTPEPDENEPEFKSLDEVVSFFRREMADIKKLVKPDKKTRSSKDDFKLYHEQTEERLNALNDKAASIESMVEGFLQKLSHPGTERGFSRLWDFLFKAD